jgi:glycosyltransferase involved in cell wall biosynthesis
MTPRSVHSPTSLSVVIPLYNEWENLWPLYKNLAAVLGALGRPYEILFVDDGSRDASAQTLREIAQLDSDVKIVELARNFGQTAALHAGLRHATGDVVVTMDGDLQNDPADIPKMLAKIDEGFDLVHGWRRDRQDFLISRRVPSWIANRLISRVTGFPIHDLGCTLKAIRREIAQELELYGEMHRFIPILAHARGARCIEMVTRHHPRRFGQTKYGIGRTFRVVLDLMTVQYLLKYSASPMKLFGRIGMACTFAAAASAVATAVMKIQSNTDMTGNPLLLLAVLSAILGVQFFSLGLLGETSARIYYNQPGKRNYAVRNLVNFNEPITDGETAPRRAA